MEESHAIQTWNQQFPAHLDALQDVMDFVSIAAASVGFVSGEIEHMQIAVEEAFVNIVSYAYAPSSTGEAQVCCHFHGDDRFDIVLTDAGKAYNPLAAKQADRMASIEERQIGGLGVFLMQKLMHEVTYVRQQDKNVLTLSKYKGRALPES